MCCSVLQCAVVYSSVLQCVAVRCSVLRCIAVCCSALLCVAVCCSVLQCVAVPREDDSGGLKDVLLHEIINIPVFAKHL